MSESTKGPVALRKNKLPQLYQRLRRLGFKPGRGCDGPSLVWEWVKARSVSALEKVVFCREKIDANGDWLFVRVTARRPFAITGAILMEQYSQERSAELEHLLRQTKEYYQQTISPYIVNPMPDLAQWFIAEEAYAKLRQATGMARQWNKTEEGRQCPVSADAFPDLNSSEFRLPEPLCKNPNLDRAVEIQSPPAGMSPAESLRWARQRQLEYAALPEAPDFATRINLDVRETVTFKQIIASNATSENLPLLPPLLVDPPRITNETLKKLVTDFLQTLPGDKSREQTMSNLDRDLVPLRLLCELRRERFARHGHHPTRIDALRRRRKPSNQSPSPDYFYSMKAAAEFAGVSERTIKNWKRDGWLKVEQTERKIRIARAELEKCRRNKAP